MNKQLLPESTENTRQIDIVVTVDAEQHRSHRRMRELEAAQRRDEGAGTALVAMAIGFLLGGFFCGDE